MLAEILLALYLIEEDLRAQARSDVRSDVGGQRERRWRSEVDVRGQKSELAVGGKRESTRQSAWSSGYSPQRARRSQRREIEIRGQPFGLLPVR